MYADESKSDSWHTARVRTNLDTRARVDLGGESPGKGKIGPSYHFTVRIISRRRTYSRTDPPNEIAFCSQFSDLLPFPPTSRSFIRVVYLHNNCAGSVRVVCNSMHAKTKSESI